MSPWNWAASAEVRGGPAGAPEDGHSPEHEPPLLDRLDALRHHLNSQFVGEQARRPDDAFNGLCTPHRPGNSGDVKASAAPADSGIKSAVTEQRQPNRRPS